MTAMTTVLGAIVAHMTYGPRDQKLDERDPAKPLVFVPGLTQHEQEFVRENRSKLGSGRAKRAADYSKARWRLFRALPDVVQLLIVVILIGVVINTPYLLMYVIRAVRAPDRHASARMLVSLLASVGLIAAIVMVSVTL